MAITKNRKKMKTKLHLPLSFVLFSALTISFASCEKVTSTISLLNAQDTALAVINKQNTEKYVLIKTTLQELAELSGPVMLKQEGRKMTQSEELKTRIKMIKEKIATLEKMVSDSSDSLVVRNLTALLQEKEEKIRLLQKKVSNQSSVIKQQSEDLHAANQKLHKQNIELSNMNNELINKYRLLEDKNRIINNQQQKLSNILYIVANDYMKMGAFSFYEMKKSNSRNLQRTCYNNAITRFLDVQNTSGRDCSNEISNAKRLRDAIKN